MVRQARENIDAQQWAGESVNRNNRSRQRRSRSRRYGIVALLIALLAATAAAWLFHRAQQVQESVSASMISAGTVRNSFSTGDFEAAREAFHQLQAEISVAHQAGIDPLWRAVGSIPIIGANFAAVTEVTVSAQDVVSRTAPLVNHGALLEWNNITPVGGRVNVAPIQEIAPSLSVAARTVHLSHQRLHELDSSFLFPQVRTGVAQATDALAELDTSLTAASAAANLVPSMLGTDEPRQYLVLIQNSAEIRATGGIPGALAVLTAEDGEVKLTAQGSTADMGRFDPAVIVDPEQISIYSTRMGRFIQSVNLTPDFPTAAETAAEMWETSDRGTAVDGVIALDTVVLSHLLRATGPVELPLTINEANGIDTPLDLPTSLTSDNVVPTLLSEVYAEIGNPKQQDEYFAAVASEVFEALASGNGEGKGLIQSLAESTDEGRIYLWSARSDEQEVIASTNLVGSVSDSGGAAFGAYFNDGTGAKMDYYVQRTVELRQSCTPEGYMQYTLAAQLTNTAPADAAASLPSYVTGAGAFGVPPGTIQTNFIGYGPSRSFLQTARINGEAVPLGSHRHGDRPVGVLTTRLTPGQTASVELDFTNVVQQSEATLDVTPTIQPMSHVVLPLQKDSSCS